MNLRKIHWRNIIFPSFQLKLLPSMLGIALLGGVIASIYGIIHDQITYSISQEYFTKLKFIQFHRANFGFPVRIFVSEIGILATWWVGVFSGWFLARIALPAWPLKVAFRRVLSGFLIIFLCTFFAAAIGSFLGAHHSNDYFYWQEMCLHLGVTNMPAFVHVAYIHNASYLGGAVGLIIAIIYLFCLKKFEATHLD